MIEDIKKTIKLMPKGCIGVGNDDEYIDKLQLLYNVLAAYLAAALEAVAAAVAASEPGSESPAPSAASG